MKKHLLMMGAATFLLLAVPSVSMADTIKTEIVKKTTIVSKKVVKHSTKHKKHHVYQHPVIHHRKKKHGPVHHNKIHSDPIRTISLNTGKQCHFLFWDVECAPPENITTAELVETVTPINSSAKTLEKGSSMIGMDAEKDHKTLENKLSNTFGYKIDPARIPWCAAWANTVLADLGLKGTDSLAARSFLNWGQAVKRPEEGDVVVFRRGHNKWAGHVGFYVKTVEVDGRQYVAVLGGNQARGVSVAYYDASRVLGYRKVARA